MLASPSKSDWMSKNMFFIYENEQKYNSTTNQGKMPHTDNEFEK